MSLTAIAFVAAYLFGLLKSFISHPRWGLYTYIGVFNRILPCVGGARACRSSAGRCGQS